MEIIAMNYTLAPTFNLICCSEKLDHASFRPGDPRGRQSRFKVSFGILRSAGTISLAAIWWQLAPVTRG